MSQMTSFWKATKACWKLRVLVKMVTVTARNAQAPVGKGSKTSPAQEHRLCLTSRDEPSMQSHDGSCLQDRSLFQQCMSPDKQDGLEGAVTRRYKFPVKKPQLPSSQPVVMPSTASGGH